MTLADRDARAGRTLARAAAVVGLLYAALSAYWASGGTWLLDTIGGRLGEAGRAGAGTVVLAVWAAVVLKTVAAGLPLLAVYRRSRPGRYRAVRVLAWTEAAILAGYGLVLTTAGLLVQTGIVHTSPTADHRALAWHAYLWDPWFLCWGILVAAALIRGRRHQSRDPATGHATTSTQSNCSATPSSGSACTATTPSTPSAACARRCTAFVSPETSGGFGIPLDIDTSYERLVGAIISSFARLPAGPASAEPQPNGGAHATV